MKYFRYSSFRNGVLIAGSLVLGVGTAVYGLDRSADKQGERALHARTVNAKIDHLIQGHDQEMRRALRTEIASIRPSGMTLATLSRRYRSGDAFLRNQIESIIGQMDFADSPTSAAAIAAASKDLELFVAITFGLGNSPSPESRRAALGLIERHQFVSRTEAEAAADTVRWVLNDTLVSADFAWLASALETGELSPTQLDVALTAADRLRSSEAITFVKNAARLAQSDEERASLEERLNALRSTARPER